MVDLQVSRGPQIVGVTAAMLPVTLLAVAMRVYVRGYLTKAGLRMDDWCIVASAALYILIAALLFQGVHYGLGKHNETLSIDDEIQALKYQSLVGTLYIADVAIIKVGIGLTLLRISVQQRYIWTIRTALAIIVVCSAALFFFNIFQCTPVRASWDRRIENKKCASAHSLLTAAYELSALSITSDWLFALLPIPMIWNAQMSVRAKASVAFILSLGVLASVATIIRLALLIEVLQSADILYSSSEALIWTIVEPALGIIAASMVTFRPLMRAVRAVGCNGCNGVGGHHSDTPRSSGQELNVLSPIGTELQRSNSAERSEIAITYSKEDRWSVADTEETSIGQTTMELEKHRASKYYVSVAVTS